MSTDFHIIIPARFQSTRLPGKLLLELEGKTVLERVYRQAMKANPLSITIATDNREIFNKALSWGAEVYMTDTHHQSGTDRIAEVVQRGNFSPDAIIVNVQGDEPLIQPELIKQVAKSLQQGKAPMATLCWPIEDKTMISNPNIVKVVRDKAHHALYFSRSPIPAIRDVNTAKAFPYYRHIGLYAYLAEFLLKVVEWPTCELEQVEALEQLRVLWHGYPIKVDKACLRPLQDINTEQDLKQAQAFLAVQS